MADLGWDLPWSGRMGTCSPSYHEPNCSCPVREPFSPIPSVPIALALEATPAQIREFQDALNAITSGDWKYHVIRLGAPEREEAERAFLAASIAVWREIDRLDAEPEGYHPVRMSVELRKAEREAWERYRDTLEPGDG